MIVLNSSIGRFVNDGLKDYLFFHGTSYLGMTVNEEFHKLINDGFRLYGSNYPTSRISNIRHSLYEEFEHRIAILTGFEQAVSVSSGYLAGQIVSTLYEEFEDVYFAPDVHPSLTTRHSNQILSFDEWIESVIQTANTTDHKRIAIVVNSLNSLLGIVYDFSFIFRFNDSIDVTIIIDDSHGFGILGSKGEGIVSVLPHKDNIHYIIASSMAKAFGIMGGCVLSDNTTALKLRSSAIYTSSSAISPAYLYAFLNSDTIYANMREKLLYNILFFNGLIKDSHNLKHDNRFPVYYSPDASLYDLCLENGIIVSSFSYPYPESDKVTRIVINALHEKEDLLELANVVTAF